MKSGRCLGALPWGTTQLDQLVQCTDDSCRGQAGVDFNLHRSAVEVIVDVEAWEATASPRGVGDEVC